jgi:tetratricopeptide (TPR) repeat protein
MFFETRFPACLRRTLLATSMLLAGTNALAQAGGYNHQVDPLAQQNREQGQTQPEATKCLSPIGSRQTQASCSHYDRAVQPPQPGQPAREVKGAPKPDGLLFPGATRVSPELQATQSGGKALNDIIALSQAKDYAQALQKADVLALATRNIYERSFAYDLAGNAAADAGDKDKAAAYFKQALDSNGLNNDDHYQVMYNLAVIQYQTKHPAQALATLDRLTAETHSDNPQHLTLKGALLADLNRPLEAGALYEQAYARDPSNTKALMNAVAAYQQANAFSKSNALLASVQQKGALADANGYRALYVGYLNDNKPTQALAVIDEGITKGVVKPSAELATAYSVIAQTAYAAGDAATAIAMYQRAAPMASDGEASLNLARVFFNEKRLPEARQAAQKALQKGVRNTAEAQKIAAQKST